MADNETTATPITAPRVSWDSFYVGPEGFGEHFQVVAESSGPIIEGRRMLLDWLKTIGAKPQPRDIAWPSKAPAATSRPDPMLAAAHQVLGASVTKTCAIHDVAMKRIPGTSETGRVSRTTGKPYNSFWICEAAPGCRGGE